MKMYTNKSTVYGMKTVHRIKIETNKGELYDVLKKVFGMYEFIVFPEGWDDKNNIDTLKYLIDNGAFDGNKYLPSEPSVTNFGDMKLGSKRVGDIYELSIETMDENVFNNLLRRFGIKEGTSPAYEMKVPKRPFIGHK